MYRIADFSIEYAGTEYSSYWQGAGVCDTEWDDVIVGVGSDGTEAYDDACCHAAECYDGADTIPDACPADIASINALESVEPGCADDYYELPNVYVAIYVHIE